VNDFYLNIWNDYFGEPGDLVYSEYGYKPDYEDSLNQYFTYRPDSVIQIESGSFPNLTFYIGWEQVTSDNLNLGFDLNSDASANTFYKTFGAWEQSLYKGALMIRPILGKEKVVGIPESKMPDALSVYPNPSSNGLVIIDLPETLSVSGYKTTLYAATGKQLISKPFSREENFSNLPTGVYLIQVIRPDGSMAGRSKLLINH
ncbi:MAG: T9SS type A sorting domain-containing protein, partial [Lentimicrobium sp.]|nr:T9SS type A sorting domain-containing protein [Lentimicrobium sp.]